MNKKTVIFLKIVITILFIIAIFSKISIYYTASALSSINAIYIPLIFLLYVFSLFLTSVNLKILINTVSSDIHISSVRFFNYCLISSAIGTVLPGRLDNIVLIKYIKQYVNIGTCFAVSLTDTILTVGVQAIIAIIGITFIFYNVIDLKNTIIIILIFSTCVLCLSYIVKYRYASERYISDFLAAIGLLLGIHKILILNVAITTFKVLINSLVFFYALYSLGYNIDLYIIFLINSIVSIVSMIPITINGVGLREGTSIYLFAFFGVSAELIVSAWIISYLVIYVTSITIVLINFKKLAD